MSALYRLQETNNPTLTLAWGDEKKKEGTGLEERRSRVLLRLFNVAARALLIPLVDNDCLGVQMVRLATARRHWGFAVGVGVVVESVVRLRVDADVVVRELAHLGVVHAEDLRLLIAAHAAAGDEVHDPQDDRLSGSNENS